VLPQRSVAFPENLLSQPEPSDGISYFQLPRESSVAASLPSLPMILNVSFIIATTAERITATLAEGCHLMISEKILNASPQVDESKLPDSESKIAWASFLESVREGYP
jgi:hypothetical protein